MYIFFLWVSLEVYFFLNLINLGFLFKKLIICEYIKYLLILIMCFVVIGWLFVLYVENVGGVCVVCVDIMLMDGMMM